MLSVFTGFFKALTTVTRYDKTSPHSPKNQKHNEHVAAVKVCSLCAAKRGLRLSPADYWSFGCLAIFFGGGGALN